MEKFKECKAVSVWDNGTVVKTKAKLFEEGNISYFESDLAEVEGVNSLEDEYLEFPDGNTLQICQNCHEGVATLVIEEGVGKQLLEIKVCSSCGERMND